VHAAWCEGGVKPPHSKALRAFSAFLGAAGGMSDCFENDSPPQQEEGPGVVGGIVSERQPPLTPPYQGGEPFS